VVQKHPADAYRIEPLRSNHLRVDFCCGVPELDAYIQRQAGQDQKHKLAAVFVLTADGESVAGYYTLSAHSIQAAELPAELAKKLPRFPLPVTLLGRMAVALPLQRHGWGEFLLLHAQERALLGSTQVASWAVVVDAKADARKFYLMRDFAAFPTQPSRLFLPMKTIEQMFA
jgi:GNAT superfamily N-acetyltransferase